MGANARPISRGGFNLMKTLADLKQVRIWHLAGILENDRESPCLYEGYPRLIDGVMNSGQWFITDSLEGQMTLAHYEDGSFQWVRESKDLWRTDPQKAMEIYRFSSSQEAIDFYFKKFY